MFSPSLGNESLGISRRDTAIDRSADSIHNMLEWNAPSRQPAAPGFFATREKLEPKSLTRRVLFTGHFWMADDPVAAWRPSVAGDFIQAPLRPVSALATRALNAGADLRAAGVPKRRGELLKTGQAVPSMPKSPFDELSLVPLDSVDEELSSVQKLSGLELRVEVVRFTKPSDGAMGVSSGRVLAVSENYAAQDLGGNNVVIHENRNLNRSVSPGEKVTLSYEDGKAAVYDGLAHDVNVVATWMPKDQQNYMRMVMLDALSMMKEPKPEDERMQDAMRYALESTANFFGVDETKLRRAEIQLVINEKSAVYKPDGAEHAARAVSRRP